MVAINDSGVTIRADASGASTVTAVVSTALAQAGLAPGNVDLLIDNNAPLNIFASAQASGFLHPQMQM